MNVDVAQLGRHAQYLISAHHNMISHAKDEQERQYYIGQINGINSILEVIHEYQVIEKHSQQLVDNIKLPTAYVGNCGRGGGY